MLITLLLEFTFALYVLLFVKLRPSTILIASLLICLGIFQFAEYQVCGLDRTLLWMRAGYIAITLLPALGIHLVGLVTKNRAMKYVAYLLAAVFVSVFLFNEQSIHTVACAGNYVLINTDGVVASTYFPLYYYTALGIAVLEISAFTSLNRDRLSKNDLIARGMLYWLLAGYATFIIPTAAIYFLSPVARGGIPSIMCGFAVLLAIVLVFFVLPRCKKLEI